MNKISKAEEEKMKTYTTSDLMEILHVSRRTIYNYIEQGKLKPSKVGRKLLFSESQVNALLPTE